MIVYACRRNLGTLEVVTMPVNGGEGNRRQVRCVPRSDLWIFLEDPSRNSPWIYIPRYLGRGQPAICFLLAKTFETLFRPSLWLLYDDGLFRIPTAFEGQYLTASGFDCGRTLLVLQVRSRLSYVDQ